jgi:lipoprotein-anchoring transpeptidase ErfK/SrfK
MRPSRETIHYVRSLIAVTLVAAAEAVCQERQAETSRRTESARPLRRIVVSIPDRKLALIEEERVIRIYSAAVGAPSSPTPAGAYRIVQRVSNPTWYGPDKVVGPGKNNPVGTRWIGLSRKGYGIHGTNNPGSIGRNASHGCVRMRNRDVEDLFHRVEVGDVVELHAERDAEITRIFRVTEIAANTMSAGGAR